MKKLLNPEIEVVRFGTKDIFTTSVGPVDRDTYSMPAGEDIQTDNAAKDTKDFGGLVWNQ